MLKFKPEWISKLVVISMFLFRPVAIVMRNFVKLMIIYRPVVILIFMFWARTDIDVYIYEVMKDSNYILLLTSVHADIDTSI